MSDTTKPANIVSMSWDPVTRIAATEDAVRLRLRGDPAAEPELRAAIESAVVAAVPDVAAIEFEEAWDQPPDGRVPLPLFRGTK